MPGNGVFSHVANAQSALAIFTTPALTPSALSDTADTSVAFVRVERRRRIRATACRAESSAVAVVPLWPRMRTTSGPVMLLPSGFFARGT